MNLHQGSEPKNVYFDAFLAISAAFGVFLALRAWFAGGFWRVVTGIIVAGLLMLAWGLLIEPRRLRVHRYREPLVEKPHTWIRLVFLSDMHAGGGRPAAWFERVALEAQALDPDILFLGGDYIKDSAEPIVMLKPFAKLSGHIGKYFVLGNHDYLDDPVRIRQTVRSWGFADLTNANVTVRKEGHVLQLSALDDHWLGHANGSPGRALKDIPHITVAHQPDAIMDVEKGDTDLMVSGHAHGGQIRLPFIGSVLPIPSILGRKVDWGRKVFNGVPLIVSAGLGESFLHLRIFCPAEIVVVEIGI